MKRKQWLTTGILMALFLFQTASAQVGFGFGYGSFGGWGSGIYGGGWGGPGAWINVWPHWNRGNRNEYVPPPAPVQYYQPASTGTLEGKIQMASNCPPEKVCPINTQPMSDVTVTATPTDGTQWVSAQPDEQGNYRLSLPPGDYRVKAQNPFSKAESPQAVTIQPGESTKLDMGLYSEMY